MDDIEAFLEEAKQQNGGDQTSKARSHRETSPSGRSHTSTRSHRSSHRRSRRDRSRTPRGDGGGRSRSRSRESSRRSSRRHRDDEVRDSPHSSSSRRGGRDIDEDRDRKRRRRSRSRSGGDDSRDERRSSHRSSRRRDSRDRRDDRDRRDRRDSPRDDRRRDDYRGSGRRQADQDRAPAPRDSPKYESREAEREPPAAKMTEEEHEMRSVFVSQLSARIGDRELFQFFETSVGKVRDARVIFDRISRRSKGVAYVEFVELEDVRKAINLTGTKLLGIPIVVQYTEAERNRQAGVQTVQVNAPDHIHVPLGSDARGDTAVPWNRLYVGSLAFTLRENDIRQIFEPFGPIDIVDLHFDHITQKSKGYCFVQYRKQVDAQQALEKMNGFEIAGRAIRVGLVTEKGSANPNQQHGNVATGGMQRTAGSINRPDSLEESAGGLNNISRIELMQKLARTEPVSTGLSAPTAPMYRVNVPTATSKSVLLRNMFNPAEETERDWDVELRDDVKSECEGKYGKVMEIYVEKESAGEIYLKFDSLESAAKAITGLNGRFFGGQQITAAYIPDAMVDIHRK